MTRRGTGIERPAAAMSVQWLRAGAFASLLGVGLMPIRVDACGSRTSTTPSSTSASTPASPAWSSDGNPSLGSSGRTPCPSGGGALLSGLGWLIAAASPFLEASVGLGMHSIDGSRRTFSGWTDHPYLAEQFAYAREADGSRLGFARMTFVGATLRLNALVGGLFTIGAVGSIMRQFDANSSVAGSRGVMQPGAATGVQLGGEFGIIGVAGPVTLRASVAAGVSTFWSPISGIGFAGCESVPIASSTTPFVAPRVQIEREITPLLSIGAFAAMDVLRLGDFSGGISVNLHGWAYSGQRHAQSAATGDATNSR